MEIPLNEVGQTPLIELDLGMTPTVCAKVEWFNLISLPYAGSIKTRVGKALLDAAEANAELSEGQTIIEASSGNTGAALARIGHARGYDVEIFLPDDAAAPKVAAIRDAGAETSFVDHEKSHTTYLQECRNRAARDDDCFYPDQFENPANPAVHARTTGPEIWEQTDGEITHLVAGVGTGGTIMGISEALRDRGVTVHGCPEDPDSGLPGLNPIDPTEAYLPGLYDEAALDTSQQIGRGAACRRRCFLERRYDDRTVEIVDTGQWSEGTVRDGLRVDGAFLVGPSAGACFERIAELEANGVFTDDDVVVVPLPDRGDRYPTGFDRH